MKTSYGTARRRFDGRTPDVSSIRNSLLDRYDSLSNLAGILP